MSKKLEYKQVLVTGGAGFIGSNLCEDLLAHNNKVRCLDDLSTGHKKNIESLLNNPNFQFIEGDICNMDICNKTIEGVDIVFHQAALGSIPRSIDNPIRTNEVNISGFLNVLHASVKHKISRFIYACSSSTYGDSQALPKVENVIGQPLSPYAVTKQVNELYANVFSQIYGIETVGLRYFNVFGRKQDPNGDYAAAIPKFISSIMKGVSPSIHGDGEQTRDFTYIDNVIQANHLAATVENDQALNQIYNVAYGESTSVNELIHILKELLSKHNSSIADIQVKYIAERPGDIKHSLASINKAKELLKYNPHFDIKKGLKLAMEWYIPMFK